ncbi:hypothetical protein FDA09_11730 [Clostridium botulinum]|uniref:hypothetical protein n=1 Tax=Clostridium botulinum TaxID=1491 RepID=UPI000774014A|nr:hypothetical protein [Clostridium botulinum]NFF80421.1 hypothetical protein [Clostridium botulinum]NFH80820.1 hypothetical protein [Clostridium botulinum]NFH83197.1 hypothetical protein [Clostridium botulinum]NFI12062.1 hypothetical protein [Clostridium botulinum]NFI15789.1 hypothetical protein [Clostridium botulinum]
MKISDLLIHLRETMKAHGDLDVVMNVSYDNDEMIESSVESIQTERRIATSREHKNSNVVVLSDVL